MHQSLLSGKRTGLIQGEALADLRRKPDEESRVVARVEPFALVSVEQCEGLWCQINASGYKGWALRSTLWGVYEGEDFED